MSRRAAAALALAAGLAALPAAPATLGAQDAPGGEARAPEAEAPRTRPERTGFLETSRAEDVEAFLEALEGRSALYRHGSFGWSEEGRRLPLVVFGRDPDRGPERIRADTRVLRVLILADIHAGEVAGKEAAQVLLRDLVEGAHPEWPDSLLLLVAPIYNADGNERISLRNRPAQNGPLGGMGTRANANGLDLNRDNTKLDAAEARALARLWNEYDPHVTVDLHTTDGTFHGYYLTYAEPLHPATDSTIVAELRQRWLPDASRAVTERWGWSFYFYGNVPGSFGERAARERGWYTFDPRPRFTTNAVGLRNRFGILGEVYSYASFENRILAHRRFLEALLDYAWHNAGRLRGLAREADARAERLSGSLLPLRGAPLRGDSVTILMGEVERGVHPETGEPLFRRLDVERPERMPDYTRFRGTDPERMPAAWLLPPGPRGLRGLRARLAAHGIRFSELPDARDARVQAFRVDSIRVSDRDYQDRRLREWYGAWRDETRTLPAGTLVVPADQPLARLAFLLLEPRADDGFAAWGLLGDDPAPGGTAPVFRTMEPLEIP